MKNKNTTQKTLKDLSLKELANHLELFVKTSQLPGISNETRQLLEDLAYCTNVTMSNRLKNL